MLILCCCFSLKKKIVLKSAVNMYVLILHVAVWTVVLVSNVLHLKEREFGRRASCRNSCSNSFTKYLRFRIKQLHNCTSFQNAAGSLQSSILLWVTLLLGQPWHVAIRSLQNILSFSEYWHHVRSEAWSLESSKPVGQCERDVSTLRYCLM